jgi:hypothetical protein
MGRTDSRVHEVSSSVAVYMAAKGKIREQNHE